METELSRLNPKNQARAASPIQTDDKRSADRFAFEGEQRYRRLLESMEDAYFETDLDGKLRFFNKSFCKFHGRPREELTQTAITTHLTSDSTGKLNTCFRKVHATREPSSPLTISITKRDGTLLIADTKVSLLHDLSGNPVGFSGLATDVTETMGLKQALKEREEGYRTILESAPYSIVVTRLSDSRYMQVNEAFCRRTGYSREEVVGHTPHDLKIFVDPTARERMLEIFYRDGRVDSMALQFRLKDGRILESLFSVAPISYKGEDCLIAMSVDISELKMVQQALRESIQKYRNILANMNEGYWEVDLQGTFTFVNDAEGRLHRCEARELIGKNNRTFSSPDTAKQLYNIFNQVYKTGIPANVFDYELKREDNTTATIELSASLLRDGSGRPIGFFGISRDITAKKKAEIELDKYRRHLEEMVKERTRELETAQNELVKQEKMAVLGQLTATVSHELRNPLGVIRSSNFYLQRKVTQRDDKVAKHIRRIEEQVALCDTIVADLLEYTRGRNVSMVAADITPWVEALLNQIQEQEPIQIDRILYKELPVIAHDQEKLRRVLINLLDNALLAVRDKQGALNEKQTAYCPSVRVTTQHADNHVVVEVHDNGIGMDEETRQRAFEPLFTTRARGTGIGLANVRKIITEHNGSVDLISEPGDGTTVTIKLPCPS